MKTTTKKKKRRRRGSEVGWILRRNSGNNAYHSRGELRFAGKRASRRRNYRKNWKSGTRYVCCVESTHTIVREKRRVRWLMPGAGVRIEVSTRGRFRRN